ncbi:hypothetical protein [Geobacter sp. SVR]|uniref:hypothetical protein n=1 Tax=Geobacter sp. SVR TaxID=2495594 RepID=UPI00143EF536|nr:hypothetical protein [Geobacter sp. SVR]BCS54558.1 hypothetical protein GSVR_28660 [Geobacter sp. SVR]GCF86935.1 hypothetical protein GSbR_35350 [Geobacter sp. SVR]
MIDACRTYLAARLQALTLAGGIHPYDPDTIFFDDLPLDFLKEHDYAACCLEVRDASIRDGRLINRQRNAEKTAHSLTRRRYRREVTFRCLLYARCPEELWAGNGLVEQMQQSVAEHKQIAASDGTAIRIDPQDAARPWDSDVELDRKLRRPRMAIIRVQFTGGIQTVETQGLIPSVEIIPLIVSP